MELDADLNLDVSTDVEFELNFDLLGGDAEFKINRFDFGANATPAQTT